MTTTEWETMIIFFEVFDTLLNWLKVEELTEACVIMP